jgi:hypothetical protein
MPPTTETRWCHGAQSRLLTLQPLPTGLDSRTDAAPRPRRLDAAPGPPLGYLESSKSLADSKKFHGYLTLAYPSGACNLAGDPRHDQKCCVRHSSTPTPLRGICAAQSRSIASRDLLVHNRFAMSGAFTPPQVDDAFAGHPFGDRVHSQQANRVACKTSGRSRPVAVSGPRGNALVPLLQWQEGRTSRGATLRHFLLNRQ